MITKKSKYALKALTVLAKDYERRQPLLIADIAERGRIPKKFLELILLDLKNDGILQSRKGKGGGYLLAKPPAQIKIGAVLRLSEGPLAPLPCLSQTAYRKCEECEDEATCAVRLVMRDVYEVQTKVLDAMSLQDMMDKARQFETVATYAI